MALRIEHRVGVAAPADVVWEVLRDVEAWPSWNPLYTQASGKLTIGGTLKLTEVLPGQPPRPMTAVVMDWEPLAQILWRESGLFSRTIRYIEIEALTETGCIFANGAFHHGLIGEFRAKSKRRAVHAGFASLSEAVKQRAEAAWRGRAAAE